MLSPKGETTVYPNGFQETHFMEDFETYSCFLIFSNVHHLAASKNTLIQNYPSRGHSAVNLSNSNFGFDINAKGITMTAK